MIETTLIEFVKETKEDTKILTSSYLTAFSFGFCYQSTCKNSFWNQHFLWRMKNRKKVNATEQYHRDF